MTWPKGVSKGMFPNFEEQIKKQKEKLMTDDKAQNAVFVPDEVKEARRQQQIREDIEHRFTYHAPKGDQPERYTYLRNQAKNLAQEIIRNVPESRERSRAINKIEEAIMLANAAIARHE